MHLYIYAFIHMCIYLYIFVHRLWVLVISTSACGQCHACACVFVCICMRIHMYVGIYICAFFAVSVTCTLQVFGALVHR